MCNIGKSVNHLRAHKNLEIQKKARSLVDTWKKRVEAEMNINDAKSGSSQAVARSSRPRLSEVSHGGNRHSGGSSEIAMKSSVTQLSSSKTALVKLVQGEIAKSGSASQGFTKSATLPTSVSASLKDGQTRVAGVGKEDARSSTAMSMSVSRTSGGASRHRKSVNGCPRLAVFGVQRETGSSRSSSFQRNPASEKISRSGLTCYKGICFCYFERGKVERKKRLCRYCVIRSFSDNRRRVVDAALLFAALAIGFAWWRRRKPQEQFFDVPAEDDPEVHLRQFKRISLRALQVATGE